MGVIRLTVQKLFTIQKKSAGIMIRATPRASIRSLFERLEIMLLPVLRKYIFLLLKVILSNQNKFQQIQYFKKIQAYTVLIQGIHCTILTATFTHRHVWCCIISCALRHVFSVLRPPMPHCFLCNAHNATGILDPASAGT